MMWKMVTEIITKLSIAKRRGKKVTYRSPRIYLSTRLTDDSSFPFKEGEKLRVRISGRKLVVEKYPKRASRAKSESKKLDEK
ncbi:MAG: hypothetical protein QW176_07760 [Candidatus Bathyarchaeia archaeon]